MRDVWEKFKKLTKIKVVLIILIFLKIQTANAQYNVLKVDVVGLIYPELTVLRSSYERSLGKLFSLSLNYESGKYGTGTTGTIGSGRSTEVYSLKGWGLMPEFRIYPFNKRKISPTGFFVGTHFRYRSLHESYYGEDFTGKSLTPVSVNANGSLSEIGLHIGYKIRMGQFVMESLIGYGTGFTGGFSSSDRSMMNPLFAEPINGSYNMLRIQYSIGFLFPRIKSKEEKSPFYAPSEVEKGYDKDYATVYVFNTYKAKNKDISVDISERDSLIGKITNGAVLKYQVKNDSLIGLKAGTDGMKSLFRFEVKTGNNYYIRCDWDEKNQKWILRAEKLAGAKYQMNINKQLMKQQ